MLIVYLTGFLVTMHLTLNVAKTKFNQLTRQHGLFNLPNNRWWTTRTSIRIYTKQCGKL